MFATKNCVQNLKIHPKFLDGMTTDGELSFSPRGRHLSCDACCVTCRSVQPSQRWLYKCHTVSRMSQHPHDEAPERPRMRPSRCASWGCIVLTLRIRPGMRVQCLEGRIRYNVPTGHRGPLYNDSWMFVPRQTMRGACWEGTPYK